MRVRISAGTIVAVLSAAVISTVAIAASEPATGFLFATEGTVVREKPDTRAKERGRPAAGHRLLYKEVVRDATGEVAWYRVFQAGPRIGDGWVEAGNVSRKRPGIPPTAKPMNLIETSRGLKLKQADMTTAARGILERIVEYAERKQDAENDPEFLYALADYAGVYRLVSYKMADVPGDGVTKGADGRVPPPGALPDRTAAGRKRAADAFKAGLQ